MTADRQYKIADLPPGQVGQEIIEITGGARASVLWLPPGVPDETKLDVVEALGRAFESGRQSVYDDQRAIAEQVLAELAEPDPHPVSSQCECGGIAHHAPKCRWREGYGSSVLSDERVV